MKTRNGILILLVTLGFVTLVSFQNCSPISFNKSKEKIQASTSVFSPSSENFNQDLPASSITNLQPDQIMVDVPVVTTQPEQPKTNVDVPVVTTQPAQPKIDVDVPVVVTCGAGKVNINGKCETIVCSTAKTSQISGGTCTQSCENQGTSLGVKNCSCQAGLVYNAGTNSCDCSSGQALVNGQCVTVTPGTVLFGGTYQCFNKIGANYQNSGVVATASEVRAVIIDGEVTKGNNQAVTILYQTSQAANGKSLKQDILDNAGHTSLRIPQSISGKVSVVFYDPSYATTYANQNSNSRLSEYYVSRSVTRNYSYSYSGDFFKSGVLYNADGVSPANPQLSSMTFVINWEESNDPRCLNHVSSPLIIDMRKEIKKGSKGISLTSQKNGILFDIMGANASPVAHTKKQISWLNNATAYAFLTLPDKNGLVNGIDQLFGENTTGPDGQFSQNGYLALAKYDLNKDQVIDKKDVVFKKLRLWFDLNHDGQATQDELFSLDDAGLVAIDLKYDKNYRETDKYGNITAMRSVVKFKNGAMRLIFDLWFSHKN